MTLKFVLEIVEQAAKQGAQRKESSSKSWFSGLFGKRKSSDSLEEEIKPGEMRKFQRFLF